MSISISLSLSLYIYIYIYIHTYVYLYLSFSLSLYIYIYIYIYICAGRFNSQQSPGGPPVGRGNDAVGNPPRAQFLQFEFFELILLSKLDKLFPVEQFEATVSQSTVNSPLLAGGCVARLSRDLQA